MRWAEGGGGWGCQGWKRRQQPYGEHSQIFPVLLYHTWKLLGNLLGGPITFSLLFCSWFLHVQNCFSVTQDVLVQQLYAISCVRKHAVRGVGALRLLASLKKCDVCPWGTSGVWPECSAARARLAPCSLWWELPQAGWCWWWVTACRPFGLKGGEGEFTWSGCCCSQSVTAAPAFYLRCTHDVHIGSRCSPDFGWVKKSRKDLKLSACGHYLSFWVLSWI